MSSVIKINYIGDLRTESTHIDSNDKITTDAPKDNNGLGRKFSPTDLLASALGSCLLTIMGIVAKRHSIDMVGSTIEIKKEMQEKPRRISKITANIFINGKINKKEIDLLERAANHCPVHASLNPDIKILIKFVQC
tara:strand:+ start:2263 stop:2670 length:408 start_codon:yes stop_codon:yes gene_type:complete